MAVSFPGTPTTADYSSSGSTVAVPVPAGAVVGELLLVHISLGASGANVTTPSGWTKIQFAQDAMGPSDINMWTGYHVVTAAEPASYTFTHTATTYRTCTMLRVAGANTTTPVRTSANSSSAARSATLAGPALVGVQSTDATVYLWSVGDDAGGAQGAVTALSAPWTTLFSRVNATTKAVYAVWATGAQTAPTASTGDVNDVWASTAVAIQASAGGGSSATSVGGITLGATVSPTSSPASATGTVTLGGTGTGRAPGSASGAGTVTLGGTATGSTISLAASAVGTVTLGGAATGSLPPPPIPVTTAPQPVISTDMLRSGGFSLWYAVDAYLGATPIATDLRPIDGSIVDTMKPGVRRQLSLSLAPTPGLYDLLSPSGITLKVTANLRDLSQTVTQVPMGVFSPDSDQFSVGGGVIQITAPDYWSKIVRAKFIGPEQSIGGLTVTQQIAHLIQGAVGSATPVTITASSQATVPTMTWTKDRDKAILDLASGINAWVYADRSGNWVVADIPSLSSGIEWLVDANPAGVLLSLDRQRSRTSTFNVVCVEPQSASDPTFQTTWVWDTDPNSPTYAGPLGNGTTPPNPALAGPFGLNVYNYDTELPLDPGSAKALAYNILAKTVGLSKQVSLTMGHNPYVDAGDICGVLPPQERYDIARYTETHMAETVTHPLTLDNTGVKIDGRSSRTDPYI